MNKQKAIEEAKKLGPEYRYVAMDRNRWWHAYIKKPYYEDGYWYPIGGVYKKLFRDSDSKNSLAKIYDDE